MCVETFSRSALALFQTEAMWFAVGTMKKRVIKPTNEITTNNVEKCVKILFDCWNKSKILFCIVDVCLKPVSLHGAKWRI